MPRVIPEITICFGSPTWFYDFTILTDFNIDFNYRIVFKNLSYFGYGESGASVHGPDNFSLAFNYKALYY